MKIGISAAVLVAGMTGVAGAQAGAQMTGVSHPEQVPIVTTEDGIKQPVVYLAPVPSLVPVQAIPVEAAPGRPVLTAAVMDDVKLTARPDIDANVVTRVAGPTNQLPIGTTVKVKMTQDLSTKTTAVGSPFTAELVQPVLRDGRVILPVGSTLTGRVSEVHGGRRISGQASLRLMPQRVTLPDGTVYALHGQVIDTELFKSMKVDAEGTILHKGSKGKEAAALGLSTGAGAASGAVFGGWPGAIIGAGVGAGVSTVVWLKQDRQAELPTGTGVTFILTEAFTVSER